MTRGNAWKGDTVGYFSVHRRLQRGKRFSVCVKCGSSIRVQAALKHNAKSIRSDLVGWFSYDESDYVALCRDCHIKYDNGLVPLVDITMGPGAL